jgi:hypothetical protein
MQVQDQYRALCSKAVVAPLRDELFVAVEALVCGGLVSSSAARVREKRDAKVCSVLYIFTTTESFLQFIFLLWVSSDRRLYI